MHPRIYKAVGAARALGSDLGLETTFSDDGGEVATVCAVMEVREGLCVAEMVTFSLQDGDLVRRAQLQGLTVPLSEIAELETYHRAVVALTAWACAARRLARRLP